MNREPDDAFGAITVAIAYRGGFGHTASQAWAVTDGAAAVPQTTVLLLNVATVAGASPSGGDVPGRSPSADV